MTLWVAVQKIYSKMHTVSCINTYHGILKDLVIHGMFKNTKTWISQEKNAKTIELNAKI